MSKERTRPMSLKSRSRLRYRMVRDTLLTLTLQREDIL